MNARFLLLIIYLVKRCMCSVWLKLARFSFHFTFLLIFT
jgi:hypothetical protein